MIFKFSLVIKFGKERYYAYNKNAECLHKAFKKAVITRDHINVLREYGWTIKIVGYGDKSDETDPHIIEKIQQEIDNI